MRFEFPKVSFVEVFAVVAGIVIYDFVFSGALAKTLETTGFRPLSCGCGGTCGPCSGQMKNVTDRAQVVDVTPLNDKVPAS